jgi:Uma2 family endonuclease
MTQPLASPTCPPRSNELVCDDGEPMETARHRQQMVVLIESLEHAWQHRDDFYIGGNMFLYFSETQARHNDFRGPDVFVVMNTNRRERRAWVVWEENGQVPDVVIELLSDKTEHVDRGEKMVVYARLRVGEYFLFDPFSSVSEGYELDVLHGRYTKKIPNDQGWLRCERLGLYLAPARSSLWKVEAAWLRWLDDRGHVLPMPSESADAEAQRADAEAQRADAEAQRADAEAQRADRLAAEIEALKRR